MGGIGVSGNGALFVVWTRSSGTAGDYPSSYAAYNLPTDAPNSISPAELLAAGQANHTGGRWGDYVGVAQDPQDPNAVWQGNEYASSDGAWGTFVSQLKTVASGATFVPLSPARLLDTRVGNGLCRHVQRRRAAHLPGDGAGRRAGQRDRGHRQPDGHRPDHRRLRCSSPRRPIASPTSSTLNFPLGDNRANGVTVALSAGGHAERHLRRGRRRQRPHLVFDVTGYFVPDTSGATYVSADPDPPARHPGRQRPGRHVQRRRAAHLPGDRAGWRAGQRDRGHRQPDRHRPDAGGLRSSSARPDHHPDQLDPQLPAR